jgi:hypothetical protein
MRACLRRQGELLERKTRVGELAVLDGDARADEALDGVCDVPHGTEAGSMIVTSRPRWRAAWTDLRFQSQRSLTMVETRITGRRRASPSGTVGAVLPASPVLAS